MLLLQKIPLKIKKIVFFNKFINENFRQCLNALELVQSTFNPPPSPNSATI